MAEPVSRVRVEVIIDNQAGYGGGLRLSEDVLIENLTFAQVGQILGEFHDLIQAVRRREAPEEPDVRDVQQQG